MPSFYPRGDFRQFPSTPETQIYPHFGRKDLHPHTQMPYVPLMMPSRSAAHSYVNYSIGEYGRRLAFPSSGGVPMGIYRQNYHQMHPVRNPANQTNPNLYRDYGPIAAPTQVLPQLMVPDILAYENASAAHGHPLPLSLPPAPTQPPKTEKSEEKATGGVAAHLDYEMDQMTEFVADMAQSIVQPSSPVSPAFRKFVSQILTSTRLPSSTILLGLLYLAKRMRQLNLEGQIKASNGQVYRMLTIALLLGSKFLDDNTFQNRSWSEVTGLAVSELNTLELEWLVDIDWKLHSDHIEHKDFLGWREQWVQYKDRWAPSSMRKTSLAPLDTNVQYTSEQIKPDSAGSHYNPHFTFTPSGPIKPNPLQETPTRSSRTGWNSASSSTTNYSPPSAPETGPNTPEYLGNSNDWNYRVRQSAYPRREAHCPSLDHTTCAQAFWASPHTAHFPHTDTQTHTAMPAFRSQTVAG
ncbi:MAG: hypothetical protein M1833_006410 [Piccolia ochrophora]|nr:MAG: hypothetical protein M1833_006410 [Piccolia ochrophora]